MFTEILSGLILGILTFCVLLALIVVIMFVIGGAKQLTKPFEQMVENKKERNNFLKAVAILVVLLVLCKYV